MAKLDCGCQFYADGFRERHSFCAVHAAAPELLAALRAVLKEADRDTRAFAIAHAAIARATGGEG